MLGPNFHPPKADIPSAFLHDSPANAVATTTQGAVNPNWWNSFQDPVLTQLEAIAVAQNLDLQTATQRLFEAQAQAQMQGAALLPSLGANGSYSRSKLSDNSAMGLLYPAAADAGNLYQYGLQTMFDLDLWGKNRRAVEAAIANAQASAEARRAVLLNVEANVASAYIQLRGTEAVLGITQKSLDAAHNLVTLTEERERAGLTTQLDVANARAMEAQVASEIPGLIAARDGLIEQITLLLGETPEGLPQDLITPAPVPLTPPSVPVGLPSTLLTRRPDVRGALDQLHAATAQIGIAKAAFFPDISLSASVSLQSMHLDTFNEWKSLTYGFGPTLTLPLFEGGELRGQLKLKEAEEKAAAIAYAKTVLTAFTQVNTALVTYAQEHQAQMELQTDAQQSKLAFDLAQDQYREGLVDYLTVLNAQQAYLTAQQAQAKSLQKLGTDLVTLYQALGGGWEQQYPLAKQP